LTYNLKKDVGNAPPDAQAEFDDIQTIHAIRDTLETLGCDVVLFEATEELPMRLLARKPDIVFNIAEGATGRGREAQTPGILNLLGIPLTGSDETTMCLALDKALTKRLLISYRIPTPGYRLAPKDTGFPSRTPSSLPMSMRGLSWPVIVKPNAEGSGKGITSRSIATNPAELRTLLEKNLSLYNQDMLVEEYIPGREFTVGLLGNGEGTCVFPPMEIVFQKSAENDTDIYSYDIKREFERYVSYDCPAHISRDLQARIEATALKIYRILRCRDCARIDFRLCPKGKLYFIEINPLPGLAPGYSDLPILAGLSGLSYPALIKNILDSALTRYGLPSTGTLRD